MSKIILITGGSSGIGKAISSFLSSKDDHIVYGTSRNIENHKNLNFNLIQLDVTSIHSINACIDKVISKHGKLDVLINNAGVGITGPMEETPNEEIEKHFKTNLYGPINIMKKVLPHMRKNNSGLIINITSIAGHIGTPFRSIYSAGKSSLDIISETLNMEVKDFNINIVCVAPGDYLTNISKGRFHSPIIKGSGYETTYKSSLDKMNDNIKKGADPIKVAKLIYKVINTDKPKIKYISGSFLERFGIILKFILPQKVFEYLVLKLF
jgi:short-subunit dehydrogenase